VKVESIFNYLLSPIYYLIPIYFLIKSRGGAVVARWAHNPKVVGSNPTPATKNKKGQRKLVFFIFHYSELDLNPKGQIRDAITKVTKK
jgi:hypothetical protein